MLDTNTMLISSIGARCGLTLFFILFSIIGGARRAFMWWLIGISLSCAGLWLDYGVAPQDEPGALLGTVIYLLFGLSITCVWKGGAVYFNRRVPLTAFLIASCGPGIVYGGLALTDLSETVVLVPVLLMMAHTLLRTALIFCNSRTWRSPSQSVVALALLTYALALATSGLLISFALFNSVPVGVGTVDHRQYALMVDQMGSTLIYLGLIAMTLEHAHVLLKAHAASDPLTGLANRRGAQERAQAAIGDGQRTQIAVLIADIDHFKQINDQFGHEAGDLVLQALARRMEQTIKPHRDVLARWGGEEFLLILPGKDGAAALQLATQICRVIASEPVTVGKTAIPVTISIGVAVFRPGETELKDVVVRADTALYTTKRGGRNHARLALDAPDLERDCAPQRTAAAS